MMLRRVPEKSIEINSESLVETGVPVSGGHLLRTKFVFSRRLFILLCLLSGTSMWFVLSQVLAVETEIDDTNRPQCVVRVNTFRRDDLLARFVREYAQCKAVAEITVVWSDLERLPPSWLDSSPKVYVERHSTDSLNNRFRALSVPQKEAILSIDDDIFISCQTLEYMLDAFRMSPRQMIGLAPRLILRDRRRHQFQYLRWWSVYWNGAFSLVLTKIAVFHRDYLAMYTDTKQLEPLRSHIHNHRNCEDLLMSFLVANATKAPPLWIKGSYIDYGQSIYKSHAGISAQNDHIDIRTHCLSLFSSHFGRFPLINSRLKLIPARQSWIW